MNENNNEKTYEKKQVLENNSQHRKGFVSRVIDISKPSKDGVVRAFIKVRTSEQYKDANDELQRKSTYTDVVIFTKDKEKIEALKGIQSRLEAISNEKDENKRAEMAKELNNGIELNGQFESRLGKKDLEEIAKEVEGLEGPEADKKRANLEMTRMADNTFLTVVDGNPTLNNKHEEKIFFLTLNNEEIEASKGKTSGNTNELKGNIAKIEMTEANARMTIIVSIPVTVYDMEKKTSNLQMRDVPFKTQVYSKRMPETFENIKAGKIGIGDTVRVRGQFRNNDFETKDGQKVYDTRLDLNYIDILDRSNKQRFAKENANKAAEAAPKEKVEKAKPKRTRKTL